MVEQLCDGNCVSAPHDAECSAIDLSVPDKVGEACPNSGQPAQKKAALPCNHALCKCLLLVALSIFQIGCREQSKSRFSFPEHPTPLPAPSDQIEMGAVHRESSDMLKKS